MLSNPTNHNALCFLTSASLNNADFNTKTEFLQQGFLAKRLITLFYADGGNGKSWLAFALAKHCAQQGQYVYYLDFDNPLNVLKERNVDNLLVASHANMSYIHRGKCQPSAIELLEQISDNATGNAFNNCVFIFDSLRNFANVNNDSQTMQTMSQIMNLREAGATVILLHHSNKDGKNYQGSNNIRNSIDNMYQLTKVRDGNNQITLHLTVQKERAAVVDKAFTINTHTLTMQEEDTVTGTMTDEQKTFVDAAVAALQAHTQLNKTELLDHTGNRKDNKTARSWLDKYDGTQWHSHNAGGSVTYTLQPAPTTVTTLQPQSQQTAIPV